MIGMTVISTYGHDRGRLYIVIDDENGLLSLSDGKRRRICRPKKKKRIHCMKAADSTASLVTAIKAGTVTDKMLRLALTEYRSAIVDDMLLCERRDSSAKG